MLATPPLRHVITQLAVSHGRATSTLVVCATLPKKDVTVRPASEVVIPAAAEGEISPSAKFNPIGPPAPANLVTP